MNIFTILFWGLILTATFIAGLLVGRFLYRFGTRSRSTQPIKFKTCHTCPSPEFCKKHKICDIGMLASH